MEQGSIDSLIARRAALHDLISTATADWEDSFKAPVRTGHATLRRALEATAVGVALAVLYVLTRAGSNAEPDDGLAIAVQVRDGASSALFDPSHLLYGWLAWAADGVARLFGTTAGPLDAMQLLDAALGAAGIALLWYFLRSTVSNLLVAAAACGLVAFSYGYWFYSVSAEVYMLSALFLIVALAAAYRAATDPGPRSFALLGLANGLAVLGHTVNVLFAAVALAALLLAMRRIGLREAVRCGSIYVAAAVAIVVPAYAVAAAVIGLHSPREVYDWYTEIARAGTWGAFGPASLPKAVVGGGRALIGGHVMLALGPVGDRVASLFAGQYPREELYLVRNVPWPVAALTLLPIATVIAGVLASAALWLTRPRLPAGAGTLALLCVAWLAAFVPFFVWWEPLNIEFWITPWLPFAVLLALPLADSRVRDWHRWRPVLAVVVLGALFAANLFGSIALQREDNDYWRARSTWYEANVTAGDLVLTKGYLWNSYLSYFTPAQTVDLDHAIALNDGDAAAAVAAIKAQVDAVTTNGRVFVSGELLYPDVDAIACCEDAFGATGIGALVRDAFGDRLHLVEAGPREWVWQVEAR